MSSLACRFSSAAAAKWLAAAAPAADNPDKFVAASPQHAKKREGEAVVVADLNDPLRLVSGDVKVCGFGGDDKGRIIGRCRFAGIGHGFGGDGGGHGLGGGGRGCGFSGDDEDCGFNMAGCRDGGSSGVRDPNGADRVSRGLGKGDCGASGSSPTKAPEKLKKDVILSFPLKCKKHTRAESPGEGQGDGVGGNDEISKMVVGDSKRKDMERGFVQRRNLVGEEVGKVGEVFSRQQWGKCEVISEEIGSQTSGLVMPVQPVARFSRGRALVAPTCFRDSTLVDQLWSASAGVCGKLSLCSEIDDDTHDNEKVMKVEV